MGDNRARIAIARELSVFVTVDRVTGRARAKKRVSEHSRGRDSIAWGLRLWWGKATACRRGKPLCCANHVVSREGPMKPHSLTTYSAVTTLAPLSGRFIAFCQIPAHSADVPKIKTSRRDALHLPPGRDPRYFRPRHGHSARGSRHHAEHKKARRCSTRCLLAARRSASTQG
jgi:hypothetical protein